MADVRLLSGVPAARAAREVAEVALDAENIVGSMAGQSNEQLLDQYLAWCARTERRLVFLVEHEHVERLVFTARHWALQSPDRSVPRFQERLGSELTARSRELRAVAARLSEIAERWKSGAIVVPDTNVFLHAPKPFQQLPWPAIAELSVWARVVVPLLVVDELDRLKRSGQGNTRHRARVVVRELERVLGDRPEWPHKLDVPGELESRIELLIDPLGHERVADNDAEIVDRALYLQQVSGRDVTVVTLDTGMKFRAITAGLRAVRPPLDEPGDD